MDELRALLGSASPRTIFNFKSQAFKKSGMSEEGLGDLDLLRLLAEEPRYFKRPMLVIDGKLLAGMNAKQVEAELGGS